MDNLDVLKSYLASKGFALASEIRELSNTESFLILIPEESIGESIEKGKTSKKQLIFLKKQIKTDLRIEVDFLPIRGVVQRTISFVVNSAITKNFKTQPVTCAGTSLEKNLVDIWLEADREIPEEEMALFKKDVQEYLTGLFKLSLGEVHLFCPERNTPSDIAIIRAVKTIEPADLEAIYDFCIRRGFHIPSPSWLQGKLDKIRKGKQVFRQKNGTYLVTEVGLSVIPSMGWSSSDVERALALGRKKW